MPDLTQQRNEIVERLKREQPEILGKGYQVPERLADIYLGIDQGGTFLGAVEGFGGAQEIQTKYGGLKGLATSIIEKKPPVPGRVDTPGGFSITGQQPAQPQMTDQFGLGQIQQPQQPQSVQPATQTYIVQPGDTLSQIAQKLGVQVSDISGYRSGNQNLIFPNEVLSIKKGQTGIPGQVGGQNAPQGQPEASTGLPQEPKTPEEGKIQADIDTVTSPDDFVSRVKGILDAYGVKPLDSSKSPLDNIMDIYKKLDEQYGISTAKKEYEKLSSELADKTEVINENPYLSEKSRQLEIESLQNKFETKLKTQLALFEKYQHLAEFLIGKAISISDDQQDYNKDIIFKAIDLAQKETETERKEKEITYSIQDVGGRTVRFGFDKQGNVVSRKDLGITTGIAKTGKGVTYSIQDVGGRTIRYGFDEDGNKISQVDLGPSTGDTTQIVDVSGEDVLVNKKTGEIIKKIELPEDQKKSKGVFGKVIDFFFD